MAKTRGLTSEGRVRRFPIESDQYRCFACENDDTAETARPVYGEKWGDTSVRMYDSAPTFQGCYSYRCSFCDAILIKDAAWARWRKGWVRKENRKEATSPP